MKRTSISKAQANRAHILVIDDEPNVRSVLTEALAANGYFVYLADGATVDESLKVREYDLIITDLKMAGRGGLEVLALVKQKSPDTSLIMITGFPSEESLQRCKDLGVSRYLVKPFSIRELRQVTKDVLRGKSVLVR